MQNYPGEESKKTFTSWGKSGEWREAVRDEERFAKPWKEKRGKGGKKPFLVQKLDGRDERTLAAVFDRGKAKREGRGSEKVSSS